MGSRCGCATNLLEVSDVKAMIFIFWGIHTDMSASLISLISNINYSSKVKMSALCTLCFK